MPRIKQTAIPSQETSLFDLKNQPIGENEQQEHDEQQEPTEDQPAQDEQPTSNAFLDDRDSLRIRSTDGNLSIKVARPSSSVKSPRVKQEKPTKSVKSGKKPSKTKQLLKGKSNVDVSKKTIVKKPHRFRSGTVALREIKKYQKSADLLIPKAAFIRLVRGITSEYKDDMRFTRTALEALQEESEMYLTEVLESTGEAALHAHRVTIDDRDLKFAMRQRFRDLQPDWSTNKK